MQSRFSSLPCRLISLVILAAFVAGSSGCANRDAAREDVNIMKENADAALSQIQPPHDVPISPLTIDETPWFGAKAVPAQSGELLPPQFETKEALVLTFERALTLEEIAARLQAATNMRVMVDKAGPPTDNSSSGGSSGNNNGGGEARFLPADALEVTGGRMVWQGKLSNLLDQIADRFDVSWKFEGQSIRLSQQVVRTFMLHALAGSTDVGGSVKTGSTGGESGLPTQSVDSVSKLALWEEIQKTIDTIIDKKARASYSPATGTITVAGYPSAVSAVEDYLRLQNKLRMRRVSIEAQVLTVQLNKEYNNNFDLDIVVKEAFNNQPFVFSSAAPTGSATGRSVTAGLLRQIPSSLGGRGTTQLVINALSAVSSRIAVEYSGSLVTLSDQPAPLQVATKRSYVARVSGTSSDTTSSSTLEPGTIDIGLSMNLLPRVIEQDRIMLRIALGITDLVQLREFTSGTSSIQLPEVDSTGFLQNAVLHSGETLVLAGFERKGANNTQQGTGDERNWLLGGGERYGQRREIRVLLITANILPEEPVDVVQP